MNWEQWSGGKPRTLQELFAFYHDFVKPLYGLVQMEGALPQEMLFEVNAALDHLSRIWIYDEPEEQAVEKAFSHFKRSCLDVFKILAHDASRHYHELRETDTSMIDNGDFDRRLHTLWREIKAGATHARRIEGQPDGDSVPAFDCWQDVAVNCFQLETEFLHHPGIEWAKRRNQADTWSTRLQGAAGSALLIGIVYRIASPERFTWWLIVLAVGLETIAIAVSPGKRSRIRHRLTKWWTCLRLKRMRP